MAPPRRPSSTARLAAKRAPTQTMQPERPASQRTTVRQAQPVADAAEESAPAPAPAKAPAKQPSSQRIAAAKPGAAAKPSTASSARTGTASTARRDTRTGSSSRQPAAPASGRHAKSSSTRTAAGSQRGEGSSSRRSAAKPGKRPIGTYVIAGVVVLAILGGMAWGPVQRSMAVSAMDAAKTDPTRLEAAMKAADDWLRMVGGDPLQVKELIATGHGPVETQIHLAKSAQLLPPLVAISERQGLPPANRVAALEAITGIYDAEKHKSERLPTGLADWVADAEQPDEVAGAALALVGRAGRDDAVATLVRVAGAADARPARADAAMAAMVQLIDMQTCPQALALLSGPGRDRALAHQAFRTAVAEHSGNSVEKLIALAFDADQRVRIFALDTLGAHGSLPDGAANDQRRQKLSQDFLPLLDRKGETQVLAGAIKAAKRLALSGTSGALLELGPHIVGLGLPGIGPETLSEALGRDFILMGTDASKKRSDAIVKELTAALADAKQRPVAAGALKLVAKSELPSVRPALDELAKIGDKDCVDALRALVGQAYGRADVVKANGDAAAWKAWLANENQQTARVAEIRGWLEKNGAANRISDGSAKLQASHDFLEKAKNEVSGWLKDARWVPPLGMQRSAISDLDGQLKMLFKDVSSSLAGAKQH